MILFDLSIYQFIMSLFGTNSIIITIMKFITTFASPLFIVASLVCIAVLFKNKKFFKVFLITVLGGLILNNIIKLLVHRPRPSQTFLFASETSYSFPSSHTVVAVIFYGLIIYYIVHNVKKSMFRNVLVCLLFTLIFFIGISRIYLGVHYATDVFAGFIFGIVYLFLIIKFLIPKFEEKK